MSDQAKAIVTAAVLAIVRDNVDVTLEDKVAPEATWEDLGADSLDRIEIVIECEAKWSIEIDDELLERMKTVGDLATKVYEKSRTP